MFIPLSVSLLLGFDIRNDAILCFNFFWRLNLSQSDGSEENRILLFFNF